MHLPFFAAVADGLFAGHGLDVELLESAPGSERVELLANGAGDFLLTATLYHLQALADAGALPVRAVGVLHQRSPVAALVPVSSDIASAADLTGRRLGAPVGTQMGWLAVELQASLRAAGLGHAAVVDMSYSHAYAALAHHEIDLIANFAELLPIDERRAGTPLRAVPVGADTYTSAVLAADSVPGEVVERFLTASAASFRLQCDEPERGVAALRARYPEVDAQLAVDTWLGLEPYVFAGGRDAVRLMQGAGWERTLRWVANAHGLPAVDVGQVVRTELLVPPPSPAPAGRSW